MNVNMSRYANPRNSTVATANILIVEDEQDLLELLRYNLDREGYDVRTATTGEEGLKLVREQKPDLMLLDLMLPAMDGLEVCRTLKSRDHTEDIHIIMLTARGEESDIVKGLEMGADDYITKPFSPARVAGEDQGGPAPGRDGTRRRPAPRPWCSPGGSSWTVSGTPWSLASARST